MGFNLDPDDRDLMDAVQSEMINRPGKELIRPENPCHYDMFCGYEKGEGVKVFFVLLAACVNRRTHTAISVYCIALDIFRWCHY